MGRSRAPATAETVAPFSGESERAVLAAVLLEPALIDEVAPELRIADFYAEPHRAIYRAMLELHGEEVVVDMRTLQDRLELHGKLAAVGGLAYIVGLDIDLPDIGRVPFYVEIIKERALRRRLGDFGKRVVRESLEGGAADAGVDVLSRAAEYLRKLSDDRALHETGDATFRVRVEQFRQNLAGHPVGGISGISSGIPRLDKVTLGWHGGQLILIAGRPGMGKSLLGLQCAREAAFRQRRSVMYISAEMSSMEQTGRVHSAETGIEYSRIRSNSLNETERHRIFAKGEEIAGWDLWIEDAIGWRLSDLQRRAHAAHRRYGLDLIVVDHLGLIGVDRHHVSENDKVGEVSFALKMLARDLDIPVIALSQLSREPEKRPNKRPILADLRDSGRLEQDSDVVIFIYRDSYYDDEKRDDPAAELIVAKQREGETGMVRLNLYLKLMRFESFPDTQRQLALGEAR